MQLVKSFALRMRQTSFVVAALLALGLLVAKSFSADPAQGQTKTIVPIDKAAKLERFPTENYAVPGKAVPQAASYQAFAGALTTGIFEGGPGFLLMKDWPQDEVVTLLSGHLVITSTAGNRSMFGPGDSFVVPKGFSGTWEMKTKMREVFVLAHKE
jgi:uncharacterized cupin superfamily protein